MRFRVKWDRAQNVPDWLNQMKIRTRFCNWARHWWCRRRRLYRVCWWFSAFPNRFRYLPCWYSSIVSVVFAKIFKRMQQVGYLFVHSIQLTNTNDTNSNVSFIKDEYRSLMDLITHVKEKREHKMMNLLQMCSMITIESDNIFFLQIKWAFYGKIVKIKWNLM